jgi:hypothetical protein
MNLDWRRYFMSEQYFQVNVELATPACSADCLNLQIDIEDLGFRKIHCVNDTYCQRLYRAIEKKESENASELRDWMKQESED